MGTSSTESADASGSGSIRTNQWKARLSLPLLILWCLVTAGTAWSWIDDDAISRWIRNGEGATSRHPQQDNDRNRELATPGINDTAHSNASRELHIDRIDHTDHIDHVDHSCPIKCSAAAVEATVQHFQSPEAATTVSIYSLCDDTTGVVMTTLDSRSPDVMRKHVGRRPLQKRLPRMRSAPSVGVAPDFDRFLGCDPGQQPSGTALVVVQNFRCVNIWHTLANLHGVWLFLQAAAIEPAEVDRILGATLRSPPELLTDTVWPLYLSSLEANDANPQKKCFRRLLFIETSGYRPGPYWTLMTKQTGCGPNTPYMTMHSQFHEQILATVTETLHLTPPSGDRPVACYMSRRLVKDRKRYFNPALAVKVEGALRGWADRNSDVVEFSVLEFDEKVPVAQQIERSRRCSILFGPHGAGLGHQIWKKQGLHIIEIGAASTQCPDFYGAMAAWYGHSYSCFNELPGSDVRTTGHVFQSLNVELLLGELDKAVAAKLKTQRLR